MDEPARRNALLGGLVWAAVCALRIAGVVPQVGLIDLLLLLAPLVFVPLTLSLVRTSTVRAALVLRYVLIVQPVGAIALVPAFLLPPGTPAALWGVPWLAV